VAERGYLLEFVITVANNHARTRKQMRWLGVLTEDGHEQRREGCLLKFVFILVMDNHVHTRKHMSSLGAVVEDGHER